MRNQIIRRMEVEQELFINCLKNLEFNEILNYAYEYSIRQDIILAMEDADLSEEQERALLCTPSLLEGIFHYFAEIETDHMDIVGKKIEDFASYMMIQNKNDSKPVRKIVYIASPYAGNIEENIGFAKAACRYAVDKGVTPVAVHLMYPQFLNDVDPEERRVGTEMGVQLLLTCNEIWICGETISSGMLAEINVADTYGIPKINIPSYVILEHENMACKKAIELAVERGYKDNRIYTEAVIEEVLHTFDKKCIQYLLANTICCNKKDGRISKSNKEWARNIVEETNPYLVLDRINPGIIDLLVNELRK